MKRQTSIILMIALFITASLGAQAPVPSPVADAAERGDEAAVKSLLKDGADVNAAQGDGMSALHWAADRGNAELAELLIYAGANLSAPDAHRPVHGRCTLPARAAAPP